jgi:hypothetical protein
VKGQVSGTTEFQPAGFSRNNLENWNVDRIFNLHSTRANQKARCLEASTINFNYLQFIHISNIAVISFIKDSRKIKPIANLDVVRLDMLAALCINTLCLFPLEEGAIIIEEFLYLTEIKGIDALKDACRIHDTSDGLKNIAYASSRVK